MNIGSTIRTLRESRKMTQDDLAKILGVSMQTVSSWELGNSIPRMGVLSRIAAHFEVDVAAIVAGVDKTESIATYLFGTLTSDEQKLALDYMHFLYAQRQRDKK